MAKYTYPITIEKLRDICVAACKDGYGDKFIFIPADTEGNAFHPLFCGFTKVDGFEDMMDLYGKLSYKNTIILG